jgi:hypothetical protein
MTILWPGGFPQQGWQCPCCKRVYAPFCPACFVCGQKETVIQKDTQPVPPQPEKPIYEAKRKTDLLDELSADQKRQLKEYLQPYIQRGSFGIAS